MSTPLERCIELESQQWPDVKVNSEKALEHFRSLGYGESLPSHSSDLFLAFASLSGDAQACAHFERVHLARAGAIVQHLARDPEMTADILQRLREKLWLGSPPALQVYAGTSPLQAWLKTLAKRCAIDELRKQQRTRARHAELPDEAPEAASAQGMESMLECHRERERFAAAVVSAIKHLSARDRNLLRLHYGAGVSAEAIGKAYGVHRATVTRWLSRLRQAVFTSVQSQLQQEQQLSQGEFAGLAAQVHDQLDLALSSWGTNANK